MSDAEPAEPVGVDRRRRVIDLAMTRRPDMTVGELHRVLGRLDIRASSQTVVADLDHLGYRVEDGDRVALAVDARERRPEGADDRSPEPRNADADADAGGDGGGRWADRLIPALVIAAVLLAIAAVVVAVFPQDDVGTADSVEADGTTAPLPVAPSPTEGGVEEPVGTPPATDPAEEAPDLGAPDVEVAFEGEGGLPPAGELGPWVPGRGGWFLAAGAARVDAPGEDEAVTYVAGPSPDLVAEVTLPEASPGAGLAFRLSDDANYLAWTLSPAGEGAQLVRVEGAVQTVLLGPELDVAVAPGAVLGVRATGADLVLLVDGEEVATTTAPGPLDRVGVGLVALGTTEVSAFDDLRVWFP